MAEEWKAIAGFKGYYVSARKVYNIRHGYTWSKVTGIKPKKKGA